jgi:hypothetical protein
MDRLTRWARRLAGTAAHQNSVPHVALAEWVDRFLGVLPWPWRRTCLKRCISLYHLLAAAGHPVGLHIGVRRSAEGGLQAHAWLVDDGVPYLESDNGVATFTTISRFT